MELHERLLQQREDRDMTQAELAAMPGTTRQQVGKYETGRQEMTAGKLAALCRALGVSADYLPGLPKGLPWPRCGGARCSGWTPSPGAVSLVDHTDPALPGPLRARHGGAVVHACGHKKRDTPFLACLFHFPHFPNGREVFLFC